MITSATIDLSAPEVIVNPYPHFAAARSAAAVQWHERMELWLAFTHDAASAVLRARTLGRVWAPRWPEHPMPAFELIHRHSMLELEPPAHTRLRRLIAGAFGRGHVERLRPRIIALAGELADSLEAQAAGAGAAAGVDLISGYAEPLPVQVIAELLGVPRADWPLLRPWSNAIVSMYEFEVSEAQRDAAEQAAGEFYAYLRGMVADRRRAPTDDLVSSLLSETDTDGARLSEDELTTTCTLLLNAGHEATVNATGNAAIALHRNPAQRQRLLEDPALIPGAVEELIRYDSPLQLFERTALADTDIAGITVRQGQRIAALLGAANRDPAVFTAPDTLDVRRAPNPHLGFGAGIHFCVGAPLARLELHASLSTLLRRFPRLRVVGEPAPPTTFVLRGTGSLPVDLGAGRPQRPPPSVD